MTTTLRLVSFALAPPAIALTRSAETEFEWAIVLSG